MRTAPSTTTFLARRFALAAALPLLAAAACSPSIDAAAKADIDGRLATLAASGPSVPAPTGFEPMPLKVGQWTTHKTVDDKGQPGFMDYKIVGQEGDAFWIEMVSSTYYGKNTTKMLVAYGDRKSLDQVDIRKVKQKDSSGRVTEFDPALIGLMKGMYRDLLSTTVVSWQSQPQEDATVPAGTFAQTYKTRTEVKVGPYKTAATGWFHPNVPISGMVKSQGDGNKNTMELVSFGETGATSDIP